MLRKIAVHMSHIFLIRGSTTMRQQQAEPTRCKLLVYAHLQDVEEVGFQERRLVRACGDCSEDLRQLRPRRWVPGPVVCIQAAALSKHSKAIASVPARHHGQQPLSGLELAVLAFFRTRVNARSRFAAFAWKTKSPLRPIGRNRQICPW